MFIEVRLEESQAEYIMKHFEDLRREQELLMVSSGSLKLRHRYDQIVSRFNDAFFEKQVRRIQAAKDRSRTSCARGGRKMPRPESDFIHCHKCNRGGNGNDQDKCACGWKVTSASNLGCFLGTSIVGEVKKVKVSRSKERYQRYREYGDGFNSFIEYCRWDASPERSWNGGREHVLC